MISSTTHTSLNDLHRLELAEQVSQTGTFEWNLQTGEMTWTPELESLYGIPTGSFSGTVKEWINLIHPDDQDRILKETKLVLRSKQEQIYTTEFRVIWSDNSVHFLLARAKVLLDDDLKPFKLIGVNIDITEQKEIERRKDEFISIASHELKTPVATLKGFAQILHKSLESKNDLQDLSYVEKMESQIIRLTELINSLLDVSRFQNGKIGLHRELTNIDLLVAEIAEDMQLTTEDHKIVTDLNAPIEINIDKYRMSQVFINIISNAIKYSPQANKVNIKTWSDKKFVHISIQDFGLGIAKKYQNLIFDRFFQVNTKIRGSYFGLGLGLYISLEIIKAHNGKLAVESIKGVGSTFTISLPNTAHA